MKSKNNFLIFSFAMMGLFMIFFSSCSKDEENSNNDSSTIKDFDGNVYHSVTIGTQTWLVENLKVTHYRNGDPIHNVTDDDAWQNLTTGAYCDYDNTSNISTTYGKLYNWHAVSDSRNIAPKGWHVSTDEEWLTLIEGISAGSLKEAGTTHWKLPNDGASNATGFTALPGGERITGVFTGLQIFGHWWTSDSGEWEWYMKYNLNDVMDDYSVASNGKSVRCVKD